MNEVEQLLGAVLAVTPAPPPVPESDPSTILEVAQAVVAARTPLLETLRDRLGQQSAPLDETAINLLAEIRDRDARWDAALMHARHLLGGRIIAAQRARTAYVR